jgi:hypothetical protein
MVLSTYVPHIIDEHIQGALAPLFARDHALSALLEPVGGDAGLGLHAAQPQLSAAADAALEGRLGASVATLEAPVAVIPVAPLPVGLATAVAHWAIHPGGRSILDKTELKLGLSAAQLVPSRETLRTHGNMSSATILFVMKAILEAPTTADGERVCAMAFGPGLTVESGLMTVAIGAPAAGAIAAPVSAPVGRG